MSSHLSILFCDTFARKVVPLLSDAKSVENLLSDSGVGEDTASMGKAIIERVPGNAVSCKTALRLGERAVAAVTIGDGNLSVLAEAQLDALQAILDDTMGDEAATSNLCELI